MLYFVNILVFVLCGLITLCIKYYFFDHKINKTFYFQQYVFKNKDNVFSTRSFENALSDMLQLKLQNVLLDKHTIQHKIYEDFINKTNTEYRIKNVETFVEKNEDRFNKYLITLNELYCNIFEYDILKINIKKININLLFKSIINLSKKYKKIAVLIKNNDKNAIKTVFFISNGNIDKKIIYDKLDILGCINNNIKAKKIIKNKTLLPKILTIKTYYNFITKTLICVCHKNTIKYFNLFGQKLTEVRFDNVKFYTRKFVVNTSSVYTFFEDENILLPTELAGCMKLIFQSSVVQTMYEKACKKECVNILEGVVGFRYGYYKETTPYQFFIKKILGIIIDKNSITINPDKRYINSNFKVIDYNCDVIAGYGKNEYVIDGKKFSNNIPISLDDIEKVDCILY